MHRPETLFRLHSLAWTVLGLSFATGCSTGTGALGCWPQTLTSAATASCNPTANAGINCTPELPETQTEQNIDPWARWNGEEDPKVTRAFAELERSAQLQESPRTISWVAQKPEIAGPISTIPAPLIDAPEHTQAIQQVHHEYPSWPVTGIANSALPSTIESTAENWSAPKPIITFSR